MLVELIIDRRPNLKAALETAAAINGHNTGRVYIVHSDLLAVRNDDFLRAVASGGGVLFARGTPGGASADAEALLGAVPGPLHPERVRACPRALGSDSNSTADPLAQRLCSFARAVRPLNPWDALPWHELQVPALHESLVAVQLWLLARTVDPDLRPLSETTIDEADVAWDALRIDTGAGGLDLRDLLQNAHGAAGAGAGTALIEAIVTVGHAFRAWHYARR